MSEGPDSTVRKTNNNEVGVKERGRRLESIQHVLELVKTGRLEIEQASQMFFNHEAQLIMLANEAVDLAKLDPLTGALNRARFNEEISKLHESKTTYSILLLDVDHFKKKNDTYGHHAGDKALKDIIAASATQLRDVGNTDKIGRWGGEEFVYLLPGIDDPRELKNVAERIRRYVKNSPTLLEDREQLLENTVSIGGWINKNAGTPFELIMKRVDEKIYEAKKVRDKTVISGVD